MTRWWVALGLLLGWVGSAWLLAGPALAQGSTEEWAPPVNISQAGDATNPHLTVDPAGEVYLVWDNVDETSSVARTEAGDWSEPVRMEMSFSGLTYQVLADGAGYVHVVWLDDDSTLMHQRVPTANFTNSAAWSGERQLATGVAAFDLAADPQGRLHLAYLRAEDTTEVPAGIYYLASERAAETWQVPVAIYQSRYLRGLLAARTPDGTATASLAHVRLVADPTGSATSLYLTWDNPALKQVFLARSRNAGQDWDAPIEMDGPKPEAPYTTPRQIRLHPQGARLLLFWQASEAGGSCTQQVRASTDGGDTWGEPEALFSEFARCPETYQTFTAPDGLALLSATIYNQLYLLAWDGERWSQPQPQPALSSFLNPVTFEYVEYGCRQLALIETQWLAAGCDLSSGGDIWVTTRPLDAAADWFSPPSRWTTQVVSTTAASAINALALASDALGTAHVVWSQAQPESAAAAANIYHARWNAPELVGPFTVLSRQAGVVNHLTLATDPDDRLLALWSGGQSSDLTFSWVNAKQASLDTSWAAPQLILGVDGHGQAPSVAIEDADTLYVAYAVPLNEGRGVYITRSEDGGTNWDEASLVFDAVAAGCELVERPRLTLTRSRDLHAVWVCASLPGGVGPLALYYSASTDGGFTWSMAQTLTTQPVRWVEILSPNGQALHVVWEELQAGRAGQSHILSYDGGLTWTDSQVLPAVEGVSGPASLAADAGGQLHLLQLIQAPSAAPLLRYMRWDGQTWTPGESAPTSLRDLAEAATLVSTVDAAGRLIAAYVISRTTGAPGAGQDEIVLLARPLDLTAIATPSAPELTAEAVTREPLATRAATPEVAATPPDVEGTPTPTGPNLGSAPPPADNSTLGLMIGVVAAVGFVGAIIVVRRRFFSGGKPLS